MGARFFSHGNRWVLCPLLLFLAECLRATPPASPHAIVALIAEQCSIQPGRKFWVGLHFQIENHWHIYWVNPGDSGQPPRAVWKLPPGFRVGPLIWPAPRRLRSPSLVDYGYENEVLLLAPVEPPGRVPQTPAVELRATVKWLICSNICVPEQTQVALSLPGGNAPPQRDPRWRNLFAQTREELPRPLPAGWHATARSEPGRFVLSLRTGKAQSTAAFFPLAPLQIENAAPQKVTLGEGEIRITLQKSHQLLKPLDFLRGVLILGDSGAYEIKAPVASRGDSGKNLGEGRSRQ